jgi:WD40 repeat protein/serine/threonine protein kinase
VTLNARCPSCGHSARLPAEAAGRTLKCPKCTARFTAPSIPAGPAPTLPEAPRGPAPTLPEAPRVPAPTRPEVAPLPVAAPVAGVWQPGDVVLDLYRVTSVLGQGGMGRVYRVRHLEWDIDLAAKMPLPEALDALGGPDVFEREAETWVNLGLHPHIVSCYYVRRVQGLPGVFAEFVDGGSLHDLIRGRRLTSLDGILDAAIQFAWGLHYAHEMGLVHRDVKPGNVMVTSAGQVKVTDFGLASARTARGPVAPATPGRDGMTLVADGGGAGTPAYMAPEQSAGEQLTRRADLWPWALSVLEMFQGGRSWEYGIVAEDALRQYVERGGRVLGFPAMPPAVQDLLARCFREDPDERPHTLWDAASVLYAAYEEATGTVYPRPEPQAGKETADSLSNRAVSLLDLGRGAEAPPLWTRALQVQPHHLEATYDQAVHAWEHGQLHDGELVARIDDAAASHPGEARASQLRGRVLLATGDAPRAVEAFTHGLAAGLQTAEMERELALALVATRPSAREGWERALDLLGRARQLGHQDAAETTATAFCLLRIGEKEKARSYLEEAARHQADLPAELPRAIASHVPGEETIRALRGLTQPATAVGVAGRTVLALDAGTLRVAEAGGTGFARTLQPPDLRVRCFAPLGRSVLCAGDGAAVQLIDTGNGRALRSFARQPGSPYAVGVSADGRLAAVGGSDRVVRLYEIASGTLLHALEGHAEAVSCLAVAADGSRAVSGALDGRLRSWDCATGQLLHELTGHRGRIHAVRVSADGATAWSAGEDRVLRRWDLGAGRLAAALAGPTQPVAAVALSPDERLVATGGADRSVRIWDTASGRLHAVLRVEAAVGALEFAEEGLWAAVGHALLLLEVPARPRRPALAVARPVSALEVEQRDTVFQARLAEAQETLRVGDLPKALEMARTLRTIPGYERAEPALALWDEIGSLLPKKALQSVWETRALHGHADPVLSVALSADGSRVLSGGMDRVLRLWDPATGQLLSTLEGHGDSVTCVALTPDGRGAVSASWDQTLRTWDLATGRTQRVLEGHEAYVSAVAVAPDGSALASASWDRSVRIWEPGTGSCLHVLQGHDGNASAVAFSPDGRFVASAGWDGTVRAWDAESGECAAVLAGHEENVSAVAVAPGGRQLASGGADRTVRLWELRTRRALRTFEGHESEVTAVAFSPDGRYVWSASRDKTLRAWDTTTGRCERVLAHTAALLAVAPHPAGNAIVAGSADRTVRLWHLDWEPDARPLAAWDEKARPYLETFVSLRLKPGTVRTAGQVWTEGEVDRLVTELRHRGFGGVTRETVTGKLQDLASKERTAGAYWEEVRRHAGAAPSPRRPEARGPVPWRRLGAGLLVALAVLSVAVRMWRPAPAYRTFMIERVKGKDDVIPLAAHAGDCSAGDAGYWLDQSTQVNVAPASLHCLTATGGAGVLDDYLDRVPLQALESSTVQVQQRNAVAVMVALADDAADRICARLADPRPEVSSVVRLGAAHLLASGHPGVTRCTRTLLDTPREREAATPLLSVLLAGGSVDAKVGFALLSEISRDPSPAVRVDAAQAAQMFEPAHAEPLLEAMEQDPDPAVRQAAAASRAALRAGRMYDR